MLVVVMKREVAWDLLEGTLYDTMLYIADTGDVRQAVNLAIEAWVGMYDSLQDWLKLFANDEELEVCVFPVVPGVARALYVDSFRPGEWAYCTNCGANLNTLTRCPECGEVLCQGCYPSQGGKDAR